MEIKLVPPRVDFAEKFLRWRGESRTVQFNPLKNMHLEEARSLLDRSPKSLNPLYDGSTHRWFVELGSDVIGILSLSEISVMMGLGQIGYTISAEHQGRGVASKALRLWTQMIFEQTPLRKLTALVAEPNGASLRVLEKNGYQREGLLKEHYMIQGQPMNEVIFGLLRSEWQPKGFE